MISGIPWCSGSCEFPGRCWGNLVLWWGSRNVLGGHYPSCSPPCLLFLYSFCRLSSSGFWSGCTWFALVLLSGEGWCVWPPLSLWQPHGFLLPGLWYHCTAVAIVSCGLQCFIDFYYNRLYRKWQLSGTCVAVPFPVGLGIPQVIKTLGLFYLFIKTLVLDLF